MFKRFDLKEMKRELEGVPHKIFYLNYNRENGIRILDSIEELEESDLHHFNKIFIFNEDFMHSVFFFDMNNIAYSTVEKSEFFFKDNSSSGGDIVPEEKEYYLEKCRFEKIRVRTGVTSSGALKTQYVELLGGER